jgi:hypothetical protein
MYNNIVQRIYIVIYKIYFVYSIFTFTSVYNLSIVDDIQSTIYSDSSNTF